MHELLSFTVGVESHDSDSKSGIECQLDIGPLVERKKDGTGISFELVVLGINVNSEGSLGIKPYGEGFLQMNQVVLTAADAGTSAVSLATDVLDPYRSCIPEFGLHLRVVLHRYFIRIKAGSCEAW